MNRQVKRRGASWGSRVSWHNSRAQEKIPPIFACEVNLGRSRTGERRMVFVVGMVLIVREEPVSTKVAQVDVTRETK